MEAWLVVDRKINAPTVPEVHPVPFSIAQNYRRLTQELIPRQPIAVAESARVSDAGPAKTQEKE